MVLHDNLALKCEVIKQKTILFWIKQHVITHKMLKLHICENNAIERIGKKFPQIISEADIKPKYSLFY